MAGSVIGPRLYSPVARLRPSYHREAPFAPRGGFRTANARFASLAGQLVPLLTDRGRGCPGVHADAVPIHERLGRDGFARNRCRHGLRIAEVVHIGDADGQCDADDDAEDETHGTPPWTN